ncbi:MULTISPECIES: MarR family winged helix-turn-helix transcriptional regulator [Eubacterium]|uniref:MarR family transcriptional regulator, 2-MHQ and catechol-resistance regulon repressor n=1 Tax=Eubacterium barkeri TaxID=1528 RepID=A0A1H3AMC3_EUBBA|nr:MarR family transcriptional regulator [Eubacterium barkeri]SDX30581.1 MarR family transcriptional regulator, 2-MHQ and catechol-resistance regulon repressor [Eubacterium barkeri]
MNTKNALKLFVVLNRTCATLVNADQENIRHYGLSRSAFSVLELLYHKGPQTVQDIGKKILLTSGSMTYVVNKLVERGFVQRDICESDRRVTYVGLTPLGTDFMDGIFPEHEQHIVKMFSALSDAQIVTLTETLKQLSASIK